MNIIVIGAAGFLGNVLCRALINKGYAVTAADLKTEQVASLTDLNIKRINLDIRNREQLKIALQDQDIVFHLASVIKITQDLDRSMFDINVTGVKNVAETALQSGVTKLIYVSSIHAFNRYPTQEIINEDRDLALSKNEFDYDKTKALGELALLDVIDKGLKAVIVNPTCFIGPHDYQPSLMGAAINNFFKQKIIPYVSGGFNFVDVRDVANTLVNTIENGVIGERYIVGGEWITIQKMIDLIIQTRKFSGIKIKMPDLLAQATAQMNLLKWKITKKDPSYSDQSLSHLQHHRFVDDSKARKVLNHYSRPLHETLRDIFYWPSEQKVAKLYRAAYEKS